MMYCIKITVDNKFYISNDNLIFISSKTILYYDLEGRKLKEIELVNFPDKLVSFLDINGVLSFFDVIEAINWRSYTFSDCFINVRWFS